jgi:hypothetical protein
VSRLQRLTCYIRSFRKSQWSVGDYPVICRMQSQEPHRFRGEVAYPKPWIAMIDGWPGPIGSGESPEEALPRPGTNVPIQFAPFELMFRNEDLAREFFPPILDYEYAIA